MESHRRSIAILAAGVLSAPLAAAPQETKTSPAPAASPAQALPRLLALDQLISVPVVVKQGAAGRTEAGKDRDKETRQEQAKEQAVAKARMPTEVVGTLRDLVVDTETKQITLAVVQTADGGRALPLSRLTWDDAGRQWLVASRDEITNAKPCDGVGLAKLHGAAVDAGNGNGNGNTAKGTDKRETADKQNVAAARPSGLDARYDLASIFGRRDVMARDGRVGAGLGVVLETSTGWLAFLRVATEHGDLAIPCAVLQVPGSATPSEAHRVHVPLDKAELAKAPTLGKDAKSTLDDAAFRAELYKFFNVPAPAYERLGQAVRGTDKR